MNIIQQVTDPVPTNLSYIVLAKLLLLSSLLHLLRNYCYHYYRYRYCCYYYQNYHTTLLLITLLQILSYPGVVELTTQLLILKNIRWLPLCRINKFELNTLPSKTVATPILMGYQDLFLAPLLGSIALFFESLGIYIF